MHFFICLQKYSIDAAREDDSMGRLVNDDHINPNCKMKRVMVEGKPHLCLFAVRDIPPGEEVTYNYGNGDWPWRNEVHKSSKSSEGRAGGGSTPALLLDAESVMVLEEAYTPSWERTDEMSIAHSTEHLSQQASAHTTQVQKSSGVSSESSEGRPSRASTPALLLDAESVMVLEEAYTPSWERTDEMSIAHSTEHLSQQASAHTTQVQKSSGVSSESSEGRPSRASTPALLLDAESVMVLEEAYTPSWERTDEMSIAHSTEHLSQQASAHTTQVQKSSGVSSESSEGRPSRASTPALLLDAVSVMVLEEAYTPSWERTDEMSIAHSTEHLSQQASAHTTQVQENRISVSDSLSFEKEERVRSTVPKLLGTESVIHDETILAVRDDRSISSIENSEDEYVPDSADESSSDDSTCTHERSPECRPPPQQDSAVINVSSLPEECGPRPQQDSAVTSVSSSSEGRKAVKKKKWEDTEVKAVEKHLGKFIRTQKVPGKWDCEACICAEPHALRDRDWFSVKFFVKNRIAALKRKL
ncbi:uncharacterized protein LOC118793909 [Megalops cyprinoides]|uniref:uncharacterized protein LOC118793909 n=1 Tax=Megalops cyprinoides TaxID=118141 RepID=UPI0018648DC3|nr:uncharacterized protein LOC118793909 [Megalops cyprinoides]